MRNALIAGIGGIIIGAVIGIYGLAPILGPSSNQGAQSSSSSAKGGRGFTGMQIQGMTPQASKALGQTKPHGVLVRDVGLGSPADKAGIRRGDLIVKFDGEDIDTFNTLIARAGKLQAGDKASVVVRRDGNEKALTLYAGAWPESLKIKQASEAQFKSLGISFASITKKVREGFGLRWGTTGVVVTKIDKELDKNIGLKPGEVILQVNQKDVWDPQQVIDEVRKARAANRQSVLLLVEGAEPGRNGFRFTLLPIR